MESTLFFKPSTSSFKGKIQHKTKEESRRKTKGHQGNETTREKSGYHGCGYHHGPWWPLVSRAPSVPERRVLCFALDCRSCLGSSLLGQWAYCANSLDLVWPILHTFILTLGSIYVNLQSKTQTSQNQT